MKDVEKFEDLKKVDIIPKENYDNYQDYVEEFIQLLKANSRDENRSLRIPKSK